MKLSMSTSCLSWLWCGSSVRGLQRVWEIGHHLSVPQFPFHTTTLRTSFGIELIWKTTIHQYPVPTQFITRFFLPPASTQWLIWRQKEMFHTCKSSYLTALVLPEQRWNHTQTPCSEDGWENSCPISIPEATQGTGNPIWPPCTANSDFFKGLRDVGTQLLVHEPSSPWALLTASDLVNCIFLKYENVWEGTVRTFKNCSTLILINRVDWKQNM